MRVRDVANWGYRGGTRWLTDLLDGVAPTAVSLGLREGLVEGGEAWEPDALASYCPRCGASAGPGSVTGEGCVFCRGKAVSWDRLTRLGAYDEPLSGWIKAMKFGREWTWARWLGGRLAERVGPATDETRVVVVPVPMPWARRWRRGFNQASIMAEALAAARGWPPVEALRRTRHTVPQTAIAPSQRAANVRGSFTARPLDLAGWEVVLVDDVKTTGSTLGACARLLKQHGARSVHAAVAAVADPRGSGFTVTKPGR